MILDERNTKASAQSLQQLCIQGANELKLTFSSRHTQQVSSLVISRCSLAILVVGRVAFVGEFTDVSVVFFGLDDDGNVSVEAGALTVYLYVL